MSTSAQRPPAAPSTSTYGVDSFVSLLSDSGVPIEEIARLVGHRSTAVTELVYRKQIRPVLQGGAVAMDRIFTARTDR
jgi:integrase